ncbi:hypothetical protein [Deinococcus hopiensis]|uniref:hypothetical protein n=1 Tax=Deinococcus hopiensis TaxID=309885 RepID=UPI00111C12F3|nr:hypothetical protein [Deinococcus hopiensis]
MSDPPPSYEQFTTWIADMDRTKEYGVGQMTTASGVEKHHARECIRQAVRDGLLRKFQDPGYFPAYAHAAYRADDEIGTRLLEVLQAQPKTEFNRLALAERTPELGLNAFQLRISLVDLAAAGKLYAYIYLDGNDPNDPEPPDGQDEWFSATLPRQGGPPWRSHEPVRSCPARPLRGAALHRDGRAGRHRRQ